MGVVARRQLKESTPTFLIASFGKQKQMFKYSRNASDEHLVLLSWLFKAHIFPFN